MSGTGLGEGTALLAQADEHLTARRCDAALTAYGDAERAGAEADRCAGGSWMAHMLLGQYDRAWQKSDAIRGRGAPDANRFWQGEPIDGRRVMLRCLHGYGDTVMYLRWLPELRRRSREVIVQACPEMLPLISAIATVTGQPTEPLTHVPHLREAKMGSAEAFAPVRVVTWGAPGESDHEHWDVQVECAELPYLFRATTATLPAPVALHFPETQMHAVRTRLGERTKPRVGVVWTGSNYDPARSIHFQQFRGLFNTHAVEFWSLQAPTNNGEWVRFCSERGWSERTFYTHSANGLQHDGIADMAAFASEMDAIITIDTMAAHIAGSLDVPTWLLLKREADWRWMLDRDDSPWYPTVRLLRQETAGDWSLPLTRACDALRDLREEFVTVSA